jgi:hypothetical protein
LVRYHTFEFVRWELLFVHTIIFSLLVMGKVNKVRVKYLTALPCSGGRVSLPMLDVFTWGAGGLRDIISRKLGGNGRALGSLLVLHAVLAINQAGRSASLLSVYRLLLANCRGRSLEDVGIYIRALVAAGYLSQDGGKNRSGGLRLRVTPSGLAVLRDIERELSGLRVKGLE